MVSSEVAENTARVGIEGKTNPYGYTLKLTEKNESTKHSKLGNNGKITC